MQYRALGKTNVKISALGFGAMRLPTRGQDADVDESTAVAMLRHAIDNGVNYIDTAYVYHGGTSEVVVGRALADGYRDRVHLATKLPVWSVQTLADCDRILAEQLARLRTEHLDFYLLHCLQKNSWAKIRQLGVLDWAERQRAAGRFRHLGFSFHDSYEVFTQILDQFDWSFCQIQYNFVNEEVQAGTKGLLYAAARGVAVIIMEPLFGGTLANPPGPIQELWDAGGEQFRPVDLALRWLWAKPEVSLVLSGMSTLEQVKHNLAVADRVRVGPLAEEEIQLLARVRDRYKELSPVPCTKCGYCAPCPNGVNIPVNFELFNNASVFKGSSVILCRNLYYSLPEAERASACQECRLCEEHCPQQIPISEKLDQVWQYFA